MSKGSLAEDDRNFSMFDKIAYTGAVAGVIPATGLSGDDLIANDMEGDLSLAGIKKGSHLKSGRFQKSLCLKRHGNHPGRTDHRTGPP